MIPHIIKSEDKALVQSYVDDYLKTITTLFQVKELSPEKTSITIDQVRELRRTFHIKQSHITLILFWDFDTATHEAQNALLKVLEEKNDRIHFFMHVQNTDKILPTIRSRCVLIDLQNQQEKGIINEDVQVAVDSILSDRKNFSDFATTILQPSSREEALVLLKDILKVLYIKIKGEQRSFYSLIQKTLELISKLEANNLNHQLTVDQWVIFAKRH